MQCATHVPQSSPITEYEAAGFTVEMRMGRTHYDHEVETRRACLLARRTRRT
ncbi:hypothetical protein GCM10010246_61650 [Streptomyces cuspidosporus]|uniref:Uncharacterized protein n=1 Tax=Streptomyces cuspidosporus TaxID=66882 RepID=A0ABN3GVL6_9ACTN